MNRDSSFTVRDLPRMERPRERLQKFGPEALSAQELLALVIGRGIPKKSVINIVQELLVKFGNVKAISQATIEELSQISLDWTRGLSISEMSLRRLLTTLKKNWLSKGILNYLLPLLS